jgi:hypothetical protein
MHHERLALYTTTLNDKRKVNRSFSASCPPLLHLHLPSLLSFFMEDRLGLDAWDDNKQVEILATFLFFRCTPFFAVNSVNMALQGITTR